VLDQYLPQQREQVHLPHARVGLVPTDLEPSVGEIDVAPQHGAVAEARPPPSSSAAKAARRPLV
jgi:hypothetical protein